MKPSILAIADSDSYLKMATSFLHRLGPEWDRKIYLARTPVMPTAQQIAAAFEGTDLDPAALEVIQLSQLNADTVAQNLVFASATGPVVAEIYSRILRTEPIDGRCTALISALPGVAYPATRKGWNYRRAGDAFICHSHAEARDFSYMTELSEGHQPTIMVSKLPFLHSIGFPPVQEHQVSRLVFAPQAKVPETEQQRESILLALEKASQMNPGLEVLIKLRAKAGEPQTHMEAYPYDSLFDNLKAQKLISSESRIRFDAGSMSEALVPGSALVTVSSTAALESIDRGLPTMVLSDFGVSTQMINTVFTASGIIGDLDDVVSLNFGEPSKAWLRENYFHRMDRSFIQSLEVLAQRANEGKLRTDPEMLAFIRRQPLRHRLRTSLPSPVVKVLLKVRRSYQRSRGSRARTMS
ncbi:DUF6716 putative glycosyltransferase [Glutamicibacter sp. AOP5-A2-18]|uniref:DUF6716 putative glycosyltransferase n=1 Tax=Glutamicibacter sp. AOP5-A2-18 TaxID=3457656 RepID=UPI004034C292